MTWVNKNGAAGGELKRLLLIEPGTALYRESLFGALCRLPDVRVVCASSTGRRAQWVKKHCSHLIDFSYRSQGLPARIEQYMRQTGERFDGVVTYTEGAVHYTNELSHELGLPVISRFRDRSIRNKGLAREKLSRVTDAQPKFERIRNEMELRVFLQTDLIFPLLVKPAEMMRGLAAIRVDNKIQLKSAYYRASNADFWNENIRTHFGDISDEVIVEEYIDGPEYGVEVLVQHGKSTVMGITKKYLASGNCFQDHGHCFPAPDISPKLRSEIEDLMRKVHAGLMIENSLTNTEIRIRNEKVYLLEINCRITDDRVGDLIEKSYDVDLARILADVHCGREAHWTPKTNRGAYEIRFVSTPREGRIVSLPHRELPQEIEWENHLACGSMLYRGGLGGESRLAHAIFPSQLRDRFTHLESARIQPPTYWEPTRSLADPLFVFEALNADLAAIQHLQQKEHPFGLGTLRRQHAFNPSAVFFAATGSLVPIASAVVLPLRVRPEDPQRCWPYYHALSMNPEHFRTLQSANTLYILNLTVAAEAPPETRATLLRGLLKWAAQVGYQTVRYSGRASGFNSHAKSLTSFKDYYEGLLSRKYPEEFYRVALETGGTAKGYVKDYFQTPSSKSYGVIIEHDLRRRPHE